VAVIKSEGLTYPERKKERKRERKCNHSKCDNFCTEGHFSAGIVVVNIFANILVVQYHIMNFSDFSQKVRLLLLKNFSRHKGEDNPTTPSTINVIPKPKRDVFQLVTQSYSGH